ncbi:Glycosyl transferases group 1 [Microbacterium sp. 77mftsu3.1]|nr:Glycosyl transferases group 1 [Microbacterium sp. 77mftsu3.1]
MSRSSSAKRRVSPPKYAMYLAVLPFYRQACVDVLRRELGDGLAIYAGPSQLDTSVRTGVASRDYKSVKNISILGRALLQLGGWREVMRADAAILDLNPRSLTSWLLMLVRKVRGRRTLLWGHLSPRRGMNSATSRLRESMRGLADGTILYGYDSVVPARDMNPRVPLWVAPNSLYLAEQMTPALMDSASPSVLYVGRLVASKKVELLIRALTVPAAASAGVIVEIVGAGEEEGHLRGLASELGVADRVVFHGEITSPRDLHSLYERVAVAVSPGYAGLSVTQALGFGVPVLVAKDEPHAPEIELVRFGGIRFFESDNAIALGKAITTEIEAASKQDRETLAARVRGAYSAEQMAAGLIDALRGHKQLLNDEGWPA